MKHVRVLVAVLVAMLFVAPASQAQGGSGRGRGNAIARLMENITLSAEQQAKVDSIASSYRERRQQMMQEAGGGMGGMDSTARAKMMEMTNSQYDDIRKVLTEDQQKVFDENRKNMPRGRRGGGTGGR